MQDYLGALDEDTVEEFITNTADVLDGKGARLNELIANGSSVLQSLSDKREEIANLIVQFNTLTQALATRGDALGQLINTYNVVGTTVNDVRGSLQGTISGLNDASSQLASLLIEHDGRLGTELETLTQTTRTLSRNINPSLGPASGRASCSAPLGGRPTTNVSGCDSATRVLPLAELILARLQDRLVGLCMRLGAGTCDQPAYWQTKLPELFCIGDLKCVKKQDDTSEKPEPPERTVEEAIDALPDEVGDVIDKILGKNCKKAKNPKKCRKKKKAVKDLDLTDDLDDLVDNLIDGLGDLDEGGLGL